MIELKRHTGDPGALERGSWASTNDNRYKAVVMCPNGHISGVTHEVSRDGIVTPSLVCPIRHCQFHEFVRLKDWCAT